MAAAKRIFGTTDDSTKAGWILPDGSMLNFASEGSWDRDLEHSNIHQAIRAVQPQFPFTSARSVVEEFERRGAIRILSNPFGFDVGEGEEVSFYVENATPPTPAQEATLRRLLQEHENVTVERLADTWESWGIPGKPRFHPDAVIRWMKNYDYRGYAGLGRTDPIMSRAKKLLPATTDPRKGGWILPDGTMLDLSQGQERRWILHSSIMQAYPEEKSGGRPRKFGVDYVWDFMKRGAIRIDTDTVRVGDEMHPRLVVEFTARPTDKQEALLYQIARDFDVALVEHTEGEGEPSTTNLQHRYQRWGIPGEEAYHPDRIVQWMKGQGVAGLGGMLWQKLNEATGEWDPNPTSLNEVVDLLGDELMGSTIRRANKQGQATVFIPDSSGALKVVVTGRKAQKRERAPRYTALWQKAKKRLGTTENPACAGYVLPDGSMLNHCSEGSSERDIDHRAVAPLFPELEDRTDAMNRFIAAGAVRMHLSRDGEFSLDFSRKPTPEQEHTLGEVLRYGQDAYIDLTEPKNYTVADSAHWGIPDAMSPHMRRYHPEAILNWMKERGYKGYKGLGQAKISPLFDAVVQHFGTTTDWSRGGWLLPDGRVIDLGDPDEPQEHNRAFEHHDINAAIPQAQDEALNRKYDTAIGISYEMLEHGAIRIQWAPGPGGFFAEVTKKPTPDQEQVLHEILKYSSWALVDVTDPKTKATKVWFEWGTPGKPRLHPDSVMRFMDEYGLKGLGGPIEDKAFKAACADAGAKEIERAGFILPDGCLVDLDVHEDIEQYYGHERPWIGKQWWDPGHAQRRAAVDHTIMQGGIRVWMSSDTSWGGHTWTTAALELHKTPTPAQIQELRSLLKHASRVYVDTRDEDGNVTSSEEVTLDDMSRGALLRKLPSMGYRGLKGHSGLAGAREDEVFERFCEERPINERDFVGAGWLMPSGCLAQTDEHSEIHDYFPAEWKQHHERSAIDQSIANGAMRIKRTGETEGHRELAVEYGRRPTEAQVRVLQRLLKDVDEIAVDIRGPQGNIVASRSHRVDPSSVSSILRRIRKGSYKGLRRHGLGGPLEEAAFEKACAAASIPARHFGDAGFLLPNGCVVEVMGGHAEIAKYYDWREIRRGGAEQAVAMSIMAGAIRMWRDEDQNALALELHKRPTDAQLRELGTLLAGADALYVDVVSPSGRHQVDQAVVTDLLGANKRKAMSKLRKIGYEGLGEQSPGGAPGHMADMKLVRGPYEFKRAMKSADVCGEIRQSCSPSQSGPYKFTNCTWRTPEGKLVGAAVGPARPDGKGISWGNRTTVFWAHRSVLAGRCPR